MKQRRGANRNFGAQCMAKSVAHLVENVIQRGLRAWNCAGYAPVRPRTDRGLDVPGETCGLLRDDFRRQDEGVQAACLSGLLVSAQTVRNNRSKLLQESASILQLSPWLEPRARTLQ